MSSIAEKKEDDHHHHFSLGIFRSPRSRMPLSNTLNVTGGSILRVKTKFLSVKELFFQLWWQNFMIMIIKIVFCAFSGSNATAGEPIGTSVLPSRVQANLNSIEEAGVGPMAPLVEDDNR